MWQWITNSRLGKYIANLSRRKEMQMNYYRGSETEVAFLRPYV